MKILLLAGGTSPEQAVSWVTGRAVKTILEDLGHEVTLLDPRPDLSMQLWQAKQSGCEFVWNGLHGGAGEDGRIQAMLDYIGLPYQGYGVAASALGMDKALSKQIFQANSIPTPPPLTLPPWGSPLVLGQLCGGVGIPAGTQGGQKGYDRKKSLP